MLGSLFLRDQMPVTHHWLYLDHAAVAPLPKSTADAMAAWGTQVAQHGAANWGVWRRAIEAGRQLAADFVGAVPEEIAFIRNTTEGVALVAQGWNWSPGDSVVVPDSEFPSNLYPWMALATRGVDVRVVPGCGMLDGDEFCRQLLDAVDCSTRIVAVSWVDYSTGRRRPLDQLADLVHRRGALLFVDAIQGLGALPLNVQNTPIDFFAADGHKWLLGPEGAGILFVRQSLLNRIQCIAPGWNSVEHAGDFENHSLNLRSGAAKFEAGTYPAAPLTGFLESLKLLQTIGLASIHSSIQLARLMFEEAAVQAGAKSLMLPDSEQSGILALDCSIPARTVVRHLRGEGILANVRGGRLRVSPHAYHTVEDIDRFATTLKKIL